MNQIDFYKDLFDKENDRRQDVTNSLNIPFTVISALAALLYLFTTSFDFSTFKLLSIVFSILIITSLIFLLMSIFYLTRSFIDITKKHEYKGIPYPKQLYDWRKNLSEYYKDEANCEDIADKHFENYLIENYIELINYNMNTNDSKFAFMFNAKKYLIFALFSTVVSILPYCINFFQKKNQAYKVEIVNTNSYNIDQSKARIKHSKNEQSKQKAAATATTAQQINKGGPTTPKTTASTSKTTSYR